MAYTVHRNYMYNDENVVASIDLALYGSLQFQIASAEGRRLFLSLSVCQSVCLSVCPLDYGTQKL